MTHLAKKVIRFSAYSKIKKEIEGKERLQENLERICELNLYDLATIAISKGVSASFSDYKALFLAVEHKSDEVAAQLMAILTDAEMSSLLQLLTSRTKDAIVSNSISTTELNNCLRFSRLYSKLNIENIDFLDRVQNFYVKWFQASLIEAAKISNRNKFELITHHLAHVFDKLQCEKIKLLSLVDADNCPEFLVYFWDAIEKIKQGKLPAFSPETMELAMHNATSKLSPISAYLERDCNVSKLWLLPYAAMHNHFNLFSKLYYPVRQSFSDLSGAREFSPEFVEVMDRCIFEASYHGSLDVLKFMTEQFIFNSTVVNEQKRNALHLCVSQGHFEMARFLLELKFERSYAVDCQDAFGQTALHFAVLQSSVELLKLLLKNQANVNVSDVNAETPLSLACRSNNFYMVHLLLESGAEIIQLAVLHSIRHRNSQILELMLKNKSSFFMDVPMGLIYDAIVNEHLKLSQSFLNSIVNVGLNLALVVCDKTKMNLLHYAIETGKSDRVSLEIVRFLTQRIPVNAMLPLTHRTALHMAAIHDWFDAVKVLVEAGADIHLRDLAGFTALDYARRNLRSAAESYLQDKWLDDLGNQDSGLFVLAFQNPSHNQSSSSMEVIDDEMEDIPLLSPSF